LTEARRKNPGLKGRPSRALDLRFFENFLERCKKVDEIKNFLKFSKLVIKKSAKKLRESQAEKTPSPLPTLTKREK
jgi:hypothetical protein